MYYVFGILVRSNWAWQTVPGKKVDEQKAATTAIKNQKGLLKHKGLKRT